jgi:hypothetical protein
MNPEMLARVPYTKGMRRQEKSSTCSLHTPSGKTQTQVNKKLITPDVSEESLFN